MNAKSLLGERMDGDYEAPVLVEPNGGPIPRTSSGMPARTPSLAARVQLSRQRLVNHPGHPDQKVHGGGGGHADDIAADEHGNTREGGKWFDGDGIHMTDSYVDQYGLPVTHSGFETDRSGRYSVVLSTTGAIHVMRESDGGPGDAIYSRDAKDVRLEGMSPAGARSLGADIEWAADRTTQNRPFDPNTGEDTAGEGFGVGQSRTNAATGVTVTSAPDGAVVVSGMGRNGGDQKIVAGHEFAESLTAVADA